MKTLYMKLLTFADWAREYMFSLVPHEVVMEYYDTRTKSLIQQTKELEEQLSKLVIFKK